MKKILYSIGILSYWSLVISIPISFAQESNIDAEISAIQAVLEMQTQAMNKMSYDMQADIWAHTPYVERWGTTGWEAISQHYKTLFSEQSGFEVIEFKVSNFDIHVNGTFASVFHDEYHKYRMRGEEITESTRVHKYLEKIDGQWKVIALL
ncbi:MAG: hypothetical protein GF372_06305 [Candidatus Marinimicrobia bacterium]|nr:hypothetical protein [Candidatus Neomarinimicrobiota bacterium]